MVSVALVERTSSSPVQKNCEAKHVMKAFGNYVTTEFLKFGPSSPRMIGGEVWCNVDQKTRQISRLWGLGL